MKVINYATLISHEAGIRVLLDFDFLHIYTSFKSFFDVYNSISPVCEDRRVFENFFYILIIHSFNLY